MNASERPTGCINATEALALIGTLDLPGVQPPLPVRVDSFAQLLELADAQRMLTWLAAAVSRDLVEAVSDDHRRLLAQQTLMATQTTLAAHAAATRVVPQLAAAGVVDVRVLKGCATAILEYSPHRHRYSSDVDLLIRPSDWDTALSVLPAAGIPIVRSNNFQRRYGKATTLRDESGVEIDLHTMLTHGYFGLVIPIDELMGNTESFEIGGIEMQALDRPSRLIHAANHVAASEYIGMHSARDVLQIALGDGESWRLAIDRSERWKVDGLFAAGVVKAWGMFEVGSHPLLDWASRHRASARQRTALWMMGDRAHGPQMTGPLALPPHRWPGYVGPFLFPSRTFLASRDEDRRSLGRRIARELREN